MARFTNQAQLRYGKSVTNSNVAVGEILEVLSATKTAVRNVYAKYDTVTYIINIVNSGCNAFAGITLTDNLGEYTFNTSTLVPLDYIDGTVRYFVNGVQQTSPAVIAGPPLVISGITIPAGGNVTLAYEVKVNDYAPVASGSQITNVATVSGGGITSITVDETIQTDDLPVLIITKSVSPVPVAENGTLTYTFLIQNSGNTPADVSSGIVVSDTFNPILSNLLVFFNGTAWTEMTNYTYDETTGLFETITGQIVVPAAEYTQNELTGEWMVTPGTATLVVSGTI